MASRLISPLLALGVGVGSGIWIFSACYPFLAFLTICDLIALLLILFRSQNLSCNLTLHLPKEPSSLKTIIILPQCRIYRLPISNLRKIRRGGIFSRLRRMNCRQRNQRERSKASLGRDLDVSTPTFCLIVLAF